MSGLFEICPQQLGLGRGRGRSTGQGPLASGCRDGPPAVFRLLIFPGRGLSPGAGLTGRPGARLAAEAPSGPPVPVPAAPRPAPARLRWPRPSRPPTPPLSRRPLDSPGRWVWSPGPPKSLTSVRAGLHPGSGGRCRSVRGRAGHRAGGCGAARAGGAAGGDRDSAHVTRTPGPTTARVTTSIKLRGLGLGWWICGLPGLRTI